MMYAGVLGGDCITFFAGRHVGGWVLTSRWFQRIVSPQKQLKVVDFFARYGPMGLFIGRFLPGLRAPIFFSAGSMKVPFWKLLLFDGGAALLSVPFFVWLGHWSWAHFKDDLEQLNRTLSKSQGYALWAGLIISLICAGIILLWIKRRRAANAATKNLNPVPREG
jgi:membrane protein DedA with SNARE-associated domain